MFGFMKKKSVDEVNVYAPISGVFKDITSVNDPVFAEKMMGEGVAISYKKGYVYAPISGEINAIVPSNHAFGIQSEEGIDLLIHVGLETVKLGGEGFTMLKEMGDKVSQGDAIIEIDEQFLLETGLNLDTPVILTNSDEFDITIKEEYGKEVIAGKTIIASITKK